MGEHPQTLPHAGVLDDQRTLPAFVVPGHRADLPTNGRYSCCFCGVGDSGTMVASPVALTDDESKTVTSGVLRIQADGRTRDIEATVDEQGRIIVVTPELLTKHNGLLPAQLVDAHGRTPIRLRPVENRTTGSGVWQAFSKVAPHVDVTDSRIGETVPSLGCIKLKASAMRQRPAFPVHGEPSVLDADGTRRAVSYTEGVAKLADLVLDHLGEKGKTLVYASGQLDYFTIFAMQEVFRLLGVRNLTGNAEHCLNAGATHNEKLTGQEGPFLTMAQGTDGPGRFYLFNGWNGFVTHPPVFNAILKRPDLDAYLIEVQVTESAKALAAKLGPDRVLLIRPRTDPHLALAVAHELLTTYSDRVEQRFIDQYSSDFEPWRALALQPRFQPERVAKRIAPEAQYEDRLLRGIKAIARRMAHPDTVPINIPSVGLSQTSGVVAHCLWGCAMAMLGKYGLKALGDAAGGTLRIPGQINAESEVQGLSRKSFFGRIKMADRAEAARRQGLPDDAYDPVAEDAPRAALDYAEPDTDRPELFLFFGTQFEANMMGRRRWLKKLQRPDTTFAVVDPIPDAYTLEHAALVLPSPVHSATTKLYQNGEWKLSLSVPQKVAPPQTRSDATILYDMAAAIVRRFDADPELAERLPHVARHLPYMRGRFCPRVDDEAPDTDDGGGLVRLDGEVSRPVLWDRIQRYMVAGRGPLYCHPTHDDGTPIEWAELLDGPGVVYGGCGTNRFLLDYDDPDARPFRDIYGEPSTFRFFVPDKADLLFPTGLILNSGRSSLSDDRRKIRFATSTFNSGKATPIVDMPDDNPLFVSQAVADKYGLRTGDDALVTNRDTGESMTLPVVVSDRVKGETLYTSFHKSRAKMERQVCVNDVTEHVRRCQYSGQTQVKCTQVMLERVDRSRTVDTTMLDPTRPIPVWDGQGTPLYVADIIEETHDVFTFRFQGDPLCRFEYLPGQFCTLVLNIDGRKVARSYTISSTPSRPYTLEITVKRVPGGVVSNWLPDNLKVGDRIEIAGPRGHFCLTPGQIPKKLLLIGAGSGVTPVMSMARYLVDVAADVDILFFNCIRSDADFVFGAEISAITSRHRQFAPALVTSTRGHASMGGLTGRVNAQMLQMLAPDLHDRHIYMCGPAGFMGAVQDICTELGFDAAHFHMESFGGVRTAAGSEGAAPATGDIQVQFARSDTATATDGTASLLELAEANDVEIDYACRAGSCGACKCKLLDGEVDMTDADGLTQAEVDEGFILACTAFPKGNVVLDG